MNFKKLEQNDKSFSGKVQTFLKRDDVSHMKGAQRLITVCENFDRLSFEQAYTILNPDGFQDEFEDMQSYKSHIKMLNYVRVFLSLAPLILTWFALFMAANAYQNDLRLYKDDQGIAFLQLWQDGFHHTTAFTFSLTALIDVLLLLLLLVTTFRVLALEYQSRQKARDFAKELGEITHTLLTIVSKDGVTPITDQADVDKIVKAVRVALDGVFSKNEQVIQDALKVVMAANNRVEQLFTQQVQPLFTKFDTSVSAFHGDVKKLTKEVTTLTTASTAVATASTSMAASAAQMTTSATALSTGVKEIDAHIINLNKTEGEMVTKIEAAQQRVATEVTKAAASMNAAAGAVSGAATRMEQAAQRVEKVGNTLTTINTQDMKEISSSAKQFVAYAKEAALQLQNTINVLRGNSAQPRRGWTRVLPKIFFNP